MTEQELIEKITDSLYAHVPAVCAHLLSCENLALIINALYKEAGYVQLAKDQSLPMNIHSFIERHQEVYSKHHQVSDQNRQICHEAQQDMIKAGWQEVLSRNGFGLGKPKHVEPSTQG